VLLILNTVTVTIVAMAIVTIAVTVTIAATVAVLIGQLVVEGSVMQDRRKVNGIVLLLMW